MRRTRKLNIENSIQAGTRRGPIRLLAPLLGVALVLFGLVTEAEGRQVRVKLATLAPRGTSFHHALLAMGKKWTTVTDGSVKLTIYTDGSMGSEVDMVRRMRVGQIQAAMLTAGGLAEIDNWIASLQNMPMMFRSLDELKFVRTKLQADLEQRFKDNKFIVLFWGDAGWVHFFSRKPARTPNDFKKMKTFAWAGDNRVIDLWKAAGYQPVPLEVADILTGLQTGLIDVVCTTPYYALTGQFHDPAPHMLQVQWAPLVGGAVIKKKTWDTLSQATQQAMLQAAAEAGEEITRKSRDENAKSIEAMRKRGLIVHKLTPKDEAIWRNTAERAYPDIRGTIVPAHMFDRVQKLLKQHRSR